MSSEKNFFAILISLLKDKKDFENTITPGKFDSLLFKFSFIFFISFVLIFETRYNSLLDAYSNTVNFKPSYNILINDKLFCFAPFLKS